jgi:hypothetical protein
MPFDIGRMTASRAVQKLLTLGLVERREENRLFSAQIEHGNAQNERDDAQNEHGNAQNDHENAQIERENAQIDLPPITPLNNNNMNEIKKEEKQQPRALCTHDGARQQTAFDEFKELFIKVSPISQEGGENWFKYCGAACEQKWAAMSETKRKAIITDLRNCVFDCAHPFKGNPYYYLCDFPDPEPQFLSGIEQDNARAAGNVLVQVKHNDLFKICPQQTAEDFGLPIVRIW